MSAQLWKSESGGVSLWSPPESHRMWAAQLRDLALEREAAGDGPAAREMVRQAEEHEWAARAEVPR
jgi:hypothetical protein